MRDFGAASFPLRASYFERLKYFSGSQNTTCNAPTRIKSRLRVLTLASLIFQIVVLTLRMTQFAFEQNRAAVFWNIRRWLKLRDFALFFS